MKRHVATLRGEAALAAVIVINSLGVILMLYSGAGISAISSVPYAFSESFPVLSLGTWTFIFQTLLVASLMAMRRKFVPQYVFSFAVGFAFSFMMDVHEKWITLLPDDFAYRVVYFFISWVVICFGIALSNRCRMPIIPTDLFPRELSFITGASYPKIKISFDVICLAITAALTFCFLGEVRGLGVGTVAAAFTMGKGVGVIGVWMDKFVRFISFCDGHRAHQALLLRVRALRQGLR